MQQETILTTSADPHLTSRLEVALCKDGQDRRTLELRRLLWGDGIGWYCQQTLRLDPREAEDLLWALRGSRRQWRDEPSNGPGKVIAFPLTRINSEQASRSVSPKARKKQPGSLASALPGSKKGRAKLGARKPAISRD